MLENATSIESLCVDIFPMTFQISIPFSFLSNKVSDEKRMALLNLVIPGNQISGVDSDFLEWATNQFNDRFLRELSDDFLQMLDNNESENIPVDISDELDLLEREFTPKTSLKATRINN